MIDLHTHLLPGLEDGAETLEEATEMCRLAVEDGIEAVVVTPHLHHELWPNTNRETLHSLFDELCAATGGRPTLALGAEIRVNSELLREADAYPGGTLVPLAGSRYLLLEFPSAEPVIDARLVVHELAIAGWRPVLAHPERIPWLAENPGLLAELVDRGALLQLTAMSVTGELGRASQACCSYLFDEDLAHFVASDAHDAFLRPPRLSTAYAAIAERWGEGRAMQLTAGNPRAVLENRPVMR